MKQQNHPHPHPQHKPKSKHKHAHKLRPEQQALLPESQRHPHLYKWKMGAMIVLILIVIVGIIDIVIKIYLHNNPLPPINASFINGIIEHTQIIKQGSQVSHLMVNTLRANDKVYYQNAQLIIAASGSNFTSEVIKNNIFRNQSKNILFIFQVRSAAEPQNNIFGLFVGANFPIPSQENYNESIDYYTFEHGDKRQSVVFSIENDEILSMNSSADKVSQIQNQRLQRQEQENIQAADNIRCKTYFLSQKQNYFGIMSLFKASLDQSPILSLMNLTQSYVCYDKVANEGQLAKKLIKIIGFDIEQQVITINNYEVYHLTNE